MSNSGGNRDVVEYRVKLLEDRANKSDITLNEIAEWKRSLVNAHKIAKPAFLAGLLFAIFVLLGGWLLLSPSDAIKMIELLIGSLK